MNNDDFRQLAAHYLQTSELNDVRPVFRSVLASYARFYQALASDVTEARPEVNPSNQSPAGRGSMPLAGFAPLEQ